MDLSILIIWMSPFRILGVSGVLFHFYTISNRYSEDPDQTPRSAASDLGLHCLPMYQKWDARLLWVFYPFSLPFGVRGWLRLVILWHFLDY